MDFIKTYKQALWSEYNFLKRNITKILLSDGKYLYEERGFVYAFSLSKEISIPDSTPVAVYNDNNIINGKVLYSEGYEIVLLLKKKINLRKMVEFSSATHDLVWKLICQITVEDFLDNPMVDRIINGYEYLTDKPIVKGQENALNMVINNPISIIWGPPGTGKTYTLAQIALYFFEKGKKVLILSQSNIAVDNIMQEIKKQVKEKAITVESVEGKIFRAGYSQIPSICSKENNDDFFINAKQYVAQVFPDSYAELELLLDLRRKENDANKQKEINEKIKFIRNFIYNKENEFIRSANILGTTISKATIDSDIYENEYDVVLLDEASMAYVPQIVYAASLAKEHFACVGDFRQLPPVVQSDNKNILNNDIFEYLGIYKEKLQNHEWLVMLNEQRRMHPLISSFVKSRVYWNNLLDYPDISKILPIVQKGPKEGKPLLYCNIDNFSCSALSKHMGRTHSHSNLISAFASVLIALKAKEEGQDSVAIIAPYKNQVNLIKDILRDLNIKKEQGIVSSTIHQYQGKESDVIIFDPVDAKPMKKFGKMLREGDFGERLVNVAITRAKGKFILVGSKKLAETRGIINQLWRYVLKQGEELLFEEILKGFNHNEVEMYNNIQDVVNLINKKQDDNSRIIFSFNNDAINYHKDFFTVLNNIEFTSEDLLYIGKTVDMVELMKKAEQINKIIKLNIGYKAEGCICDNACIINEDTLVFPIISVEKEESTYVVLKGKQTISNLKEVEYSQFDEEKKKLGIMRMIKSINANKWVKCPVCGINQMLDGQDACGVCQNTKVSGINILPSYRVYIWDIAYLWASLLGIIDKKAFCHTHLIELKKTIFSNKRIMHVHDNDKKDYYYNKNDVFNEFFFAEEKIGPAIRKCGIQDYDSLKNNILYVKAHMD